MGYLLRRWLADRLPADLSSGERLVALEFADCAWDETGVAYGANLVEVIARRTGFSDDKQVRKVVGKLSARGIELRVEVGKHKDGTPVYAHRGHQTTYRIPTGEELGLTDDPAWEPDPRKDPRPGPLSDGKETHPGALSEGKETRPGVLSGSKGDPPGVERGPAGARKGTRPGPPTSLTPTTKERDLSPAAILAKHGVAEDEREKLIVTIEDRCNVNGPGWWIAADRNGTLPQRIAEAREPAAPAKPRVGRHQPYRDKPGADWHADL